MRFPFSTASAACRSSFRSRTDHHTPTSAHGRTESHAKRLPTIRNFSARRAQRARRRLKTHGVALWCAEDLVYALQSRLTPLELELAFAPGVVAQDVIPDIVWARAHGQRKRVGMIVDIIASAGWTTQCAAAQAGSAADAPLLT